MPKDYGFKQSPGRTVEGNPFAGEFALEETASIEQERINESAFFSSLEQGQENKFVRDPKTGNPTYAFKSLEQTDLNGAYGKQLLGSQSYANPYALVHVEGSQALQDYYINAGTRTIHNDENHRILTKEKLVLDFDPRNVNNPYYLSDFSHIKYNYLPLNHLITLRRYPFPTIHNLRFAEDRQVLPLAQAVSYFGQPYENSLEELIQFEGFINWQDLQSDVWDVEAGTTNSFDQTPFIDRLGPRAQNTLKYGSGFFQGNRGNIQGNGADSAEIARNLSDPSFTGKVLGPVDVINTTKIRDRGIGVTKDFTLTFRYEMAQVGNLNPKVVFLDIMANMLSLCFQDARFFSGYNRVIGTPSQFQALGDISLFRQGDYGGYIQSFFSDVGSSLGQGLDILTGVIGNLIGGNYGDALSAVKQVAGGIGNMMFDLQRAKNRPQVLGLRALLTGAPTGYHHLTVGNPYNPIMEIGNLACTGFSFNFGGWLSAQDFPTEMIWTVNLSTARPMAKSEVEAVFNKGERIYMAPKGDVDVLNIESSAVITPNAPVNRNNPSKNGDARSAYLGEDGLFNQANLAKVEKGAIENRGTKATLASANVIKQRLRGTVF